MEEADGLPLIIKEALKQVEDRYDYAIIDCHPSMQLPTIAALVAADELLIPYEPDVFGKTGLNFLSDYIAQIQEIYNPGLTYHVFIAKYAERKSQLEEIYDDHSIDMSFFDEMNGMGVGQDQSSSNSLSTFDFLKGF